MMTIKFRPGEREILDARPKVLKGRRKPKYLKLNPENLKPRRPKKKKQKKAEEAAARRGGGYKFSNTPVGRIIYVYAPVLYLLLTDSRLRLRECGRVIPPELVEQMAVAYHSPYLRTARFRKALIDFRKYGMRTPARAEWTLRDALHYARNSYFTYKAIAQCTEL